nr:tripartite tricarboxylate transporter substrate binding protein [Brenneria tiliae]
MKKVILWLAALFFSLSTVGARGAVIDENYPQKTVRIVVPVAAGGSADKLARVLAEELSRSWGQSVVVENIPGAGGVIGTSQAAREPADGYTLLLRGESAVLPTLLLPNPGYRLDDLTGVVQAVVNPQILVVRPGLGISTLQEYIDLAKTRPGEITVGLPGNAGIAHIAHEQFNRQADIKVNFIPYSGGAPAAVDVIGEHIDATLITLAAVTEYVRAGRLVPIAVTTSYRSPALPDVPTFAESGLPGFSVESWQGLLAPVGTPDGVKNKINRDVQALLNTPQVKERVENLGFGIAKPHTPADVDAILQEQGRTYAEIIKSAGIKLQ